MERRCSRLVQYGHFGITRTAETVSGGNAHPNEKPQIARTPVNKNFEMTINKLLGKNYSFLSIIPVKYETAPRWAPFVRCNIIKAPFVRYTNCTGNTNKARTSTYTKRV